MSKLRLAQTLFVLVGLVLFGVAIVTAEGGLAVIGVISIVCAWLVKWLRFIYKD